MMSVKGILKKAMATLLVTTLAVSVVPIEWTAGGEVQAEDGEEKTYGDFKYKVLEDETIEITEYIGSGSEVVIPEVIEEKVVTSIKGSFFGYSGDYNIESLYFPKGITNISTDYIWPHRLTDIIVDEENSVYYSEDGVLFNRVTQTLERYPVGKNDKRYCIPDEIKQIQWYAFDGCSSLESIGMPSGLTVVGNHAFMDCDALMDVNLPNGLTDIGRMAFDGCTSLTNITIPDSVTMIGEYAFAGCELLESVNIPSNASIGGGAFYGCIALKSISVDPKNKNYISEDGVLFRNWGKEKTLYLYPSAKSDQTYIIPEGVTRIDGGAFSYCENLLSVQIPQSVTDICTNAADGDSIAACFGGCNNIESFSVDEKNETFYSENGVLYKYIGEDQNAIFRYPSGKAEKTYVMPENITYIWEYAFNECKNLENIIMPEGLESIEDGAFYGCSGVSDIVIPESVEYISSGYSGGAYWPGGGRVFAYCTNLKSVVLPSSTIYIGDCMFYGCSSLASIYVPENVKMILTDGFCGCTSLQNVDLPNSLESIEDYAFYECTSLQNIDLPENLGNIASGAFKGCSSLSSICIPDSVTEIGTEAFGYIRNNGTNDKMDGFRIYGSEDTEAQRYAVENGFLFNAQEAENPGGSEPSNSTKPDTGNQQQNKQDTNQPIQNTPVEHTVTVGTTLADNGKKANYKVVSVNSKGGTVTYVKPMFTASKLAVPSAVTVEGKTYKVTAISANAFKGQKKLKTLTLPASVTKIGNHAFKNCKNLKKLIIKSKKLTKKSVGKQAFKGLTKKTVVQVPKKKLKVYKKLLRQCGLSKSVKIKGK